jgi:c-di-GMP-related signal transduction protein
VVFWNMRLPEVQVPVLENFVIYINKVNQNTRCFVAITTKYLYNSLFQEFPSQTPCYFSIL